MRQGVKFHDGSPFTADDIVFSYERASHPNSQLRQYAIPVGKPRKIDDFTVEFVQDKPNPITLEHATTIYIMSKAWAIKNKVEKPLDFKAKEETFASRNANGTGAWILVSREPGIKTVLKHNPDWWGAKDGRAPGNVTEVIYTQVSADATRTAALLSGQVDFILDPPPQDVRRIEENKGTKVMRGPENRVVFFGFDQTRDELLYSNVKGKNPFKDVRVRQAVYHAIDIEAIRSRTMRGSSVPTGGITPSITRVQPRCRKAAAVRHRTGQSSCWLKPAMRTASKSRSTARTTAMSTTKKSALRWRRCWPRSASTPKSTRSRARPTSRSSRSTTPACSCSGWGGAITDAQTTLSAVLRSKDDKTGNGSFNYGRYVNPKLDALIDSAAFESNADKRRDMIRQAIAEHNAQVHHVPLHRQMIPWAMRSNVTVVHRPDNVLNMEAVTIGSNE